MGLTFDVEWLDAPGVRDRVLAATWARLRLSVAGRDVTELIHLASDTRRTGVYGSIFPLVEWALDHWWYLLHEPQLPTGIVSARDARPWERSWTQRHGLLAAREGGAMPDALFVRDGDDILVRWFPDPDDAGSQRVRFVGEGEVRIPATEFEDAVRRLIDKTLDRLRAVVGDPDEDVGRAGATWDAIGSADDEERRLCRGLALLGTDPYDPHETPDELVSAVRRVLDDLPTSLADDLLQAARPDTLESAALWLRGQSDKVGGQTTVPPTRPTLDLVWRNGAHATGYSWACRVRHELLGLSDAEAVSDLPDLVVERLGWSADPTQLAPKQPGLDALIGISPETSKPLLIEAGGRSGPANRFRLARAAFFTTAGSVGAGRLLTRSAAREQRASRAFAAELLAPAAALARQVSGPVSHEEVADLASTFGVNQLVIEHQLENHRIGLVTD